MYAIFLALNADAQRLLSPERVDRWLWECHIYRWAYRSYRATGEARLSAGCSRRDPSGLAFFRVSRTVS